MSCFVGRDWECVLRWKRPPGVAPERMPKADATGLAPKNRHTPRRAVIASEGFFFGCILWWSLRAEALGKETRKTAGPLLPGAPFSALR